MDHVFMVVAVDIILLLTEPQDLIVSDPVHIIGTRTALV